jgi:heme/copper-type cytochrome/quinol oxidase subunit 2
MNGTRLNAQGARRNLTVGLCAVSLVLCAFPFPLTAQEQAPNRREFTVAVKDFRFSPDRLEVVQDDLVKLTVTSDDIAHSLAIDEYRIVKRIPAGGSTTFEFRADRVGTFPFYCNLTSEPGHGQSRGQLVVRPRAS